MVSGAVMLLLEVLSMFIIAAAVGIFVAQVWKFPSTASLLLGGLGMSVLETITGTLAIGI